MWELILKSFYLALPAYVANMSPVILDRLKFFKFLARPIDGGRRMGRQFIFGSNKTWRGLLLAPIFGLTMSWLQAWLYNYDFFNNLSFFNYQSDFLLFGLLAGLGAILGDLAKSFLKRRLNITSGQSWPIFDQIDFIAGFLLLTYFVVQPPLVVIITVFLITLILHPLTNVISYFLGFKKVWW